MAHLPLQNKNFQTEWTDYVTSKPAGIEPVAPNAIRYNDGRIVVRALPKDVVQTTIRVKYSDKLKYVLHLYYTTCNILVQGNGCLQWVREDFDRLQGVVAMLAATLPSLSKKELKAAWDSVADVLTVPPEDDQSSVIQAHAIEWPEPAPTSAVNPTVTPLSNSADCSTVTVAIECDTLLLPENTTIDSTTSDVDTIQHSSTDDTPTTDCNADNTGVHDVTPTTYCSTDNTGVHVFPDQQTTAVDPSPDAPTTVNGSEPQVNISIPQGNTDLSIYIATLESKLQALVTDFENFKVQVRNTNRVTDKQRDQEIAELRQKCSTQEERICTLERKCASLDNILKNIKKSSTENSAKIAVVTNHGRYAPARSETSTPLSPEKSRPISDSPATAHSEQTCTPNPSFPNSSTAPPASSSSSLTPSPCPSINGECQPLIVPAGH